MSINQPMRKIAPIAAVCLLFVLSCVKLAKKSSVVTIKEDPAKALANAKSIREKTPAKVIEGLEMTLWASDSLAPDPVAMDIDDWGRVYLTRTNRQKNSEFDIRGHRDWMTESISLKTVEERQAFLRKTFAPERSEENKWLKDLNNDGVHDWHDLAVEKDEVWRLEDTNKDGIADVSMRILEDFYTEVTDVAGGLLVRAKDAFIAIAPDLWRLEDKNKDGIWDKKTSISTGYQVHIGFGGHGMSGVTEGPDGRIYWNIGDIGASITTVDGRKVENPNSGFIARANPDGSDFEIFATGLRNTHEFAFDEYGNLISSDNDGDHAGERERLVHIVEGSDAGWRSNWQYGKYTDPKNNRYNVWMDENLSVPHWDGQAAYIIPPIMNYHNGPTGMIYNPGTALGSEWKNKFFLVEFVGAPTGSHIWSFGLKPKGASFELDGEKDVVSGILPTGIKFGPDGALYAADWINGWDTKNYGRVWKFDVTKDKNDWAEKRLETKRLIQLDYSKQTPEKLYELLFYADMRVRQKAQFELVNRGKNGFEFLNKAIYQTDNQLARVHGVWGIGQLMRKDKNYAASLLPLLKHKDPEITVQAIKMLGDADVQNAGSEILPFLTHGNPRVRFYAAEALGLIKYTPSVQPLINLLKTNNDEDLYIRHAAVLALSRIGLVEPVVALSKSSSKALRTAAVLVLRRLSNENIALFLNDSDEYIVTEAARAINDDLSIPAALPALAEALNVKKWTSEPLLRRAINACLRVGGDKELQTLITFSQRTDIKNTLKAEALATLGVWATPSVLDRVDGRFRGKIERDPSIVKAKVKPLVSSYLSESNDDVLIAVAGMLANLNLSEANSQLEKIYDESKSGKAKAAILTSLNSLKYEKMPTLIKNGMVDKEEVVRTKALSLLNNDNVTKESLPAIVQAIFSKNSIKEQQQLLVVMSKLDKEKTTTILTDLVAQMKEKTLPPNLMLELQEAVEATQSVALKSQLASIQATNSILGNFTDALYGGNWAEGRNIFNYNSSAQCTRCHTVGKDGGNVGPNLSKIAATLSREQLLQALVDPSARIAPGYGSISLKLKDGQDVVGVLMKENEDALTLKTSDAEPLVVPLARIAKRENLPSSMPPMGETLSKRELRDIVEYLVSLKR
ncbi:MAG: HEAT repeat domain-containing protein [Saprospiraceae bacterium]|nr:HEAT repeat domain-containing protein [Saprospiraceae bacterium]